MTVCVFNIELKCESDVNPKWVSVFSLNYTVIIILKSSRITARLTIYNMTPNGPSASV